jgi:hypothetical protein
LGASAPAGRGRAPASRRGPGTASERRWRAIRVPILLCSCPRLQKQPSRR